ncbi:MAG TPA: ROK family protein [Candidatus Omnitrophota bacterium]|nr:ROK family protein [Candidatus Omnitrophota bacterium]
MNKYIIGIDVGGTNVKLGLVNPKGKLIARSRLNTKSYMHRKSKLIDAIAKEAVELINSKSLKKSQILGVGLGLPGFIDPQKGLVRFLPNIPGWRRVPLSSILRRKLNLPVFIDNDVNLVTLAEWKKGAGVGCKNLICLTLGTGVGSGIVIGNRFYRGEDYVAGEIGHIPYLDKTLERYVGNAVLQAKAAKIFRKKNIRLEEVFALASNGNARAIEFWQQAGAHIGFVLAGIVNLLNPKLIIVGGGVSNNFRYLAPAIKKTIRQKSIKVAGASVRIVRAKLGDDAGIFGAYFLVKDAFIDRKSYLKK